MTMLTDLARLAAIACVLLGGCCACALAVDSPVKVAVLHGTFDNFRHRDEHDAVLKQLGWQFTKYPCTELARLVGDLGQYDLVLGNPLFNYGEVQDFGAHAAEWRAFMERGGGIVLSDCNYATCVDWLAKLGDTFKAGVEGCKAQQSATESAPRHSLHFLPYELRAGNSWAHMVLTGGGWEVISRCGDGNVVAAVQRVGKGFAFVASGWPLGAEALQNVWANLCLQRLGLAAMAFAMPELTVGSAEVRLGLRNGAAAPAEVTLDLEVTPEGAAPVRFTNRQSVAARGEAALRLPYRLSVRGKAGARLTLTSGGATTTLLKRHAVLPELLSVRLASPAYRGLALASRPPAKVVLGVAVTPDKEDLRKLSLSVQVRDAAGKQLARQSVGRLPGREFEQAVAVPKLPAGDYSVRAELTEGRRRLAVAKTSLSVLAEAPSQVLLADDLNTIVGGKPFFPLALYHVGLDDLPKVAALGLNAVQGWGGNVDRARQYLDAAQANGLKVLLEMGGLVGETVNTAAIEEHVRALKDHPALLVWYVRDEPAPALHDSVLQATELFHRLDRNHPTYLVSCIPNEFGNQAQLADILAVDPYPLPGGPVSRVAQWADLAWQATRREKPVWLIPQLHDQSSYNAQPPARGANPPTPAQERCMTYLCLVHGAKGIVWYPWDDGPNMGAKYHPPLQDELKRLCAEIHLLTPALLSATRRSFAAADGKVHGLVCGSGAERFLLLVNGTDEKLTATIELPEAKPRQELAGEFGGSRGSLRGKRLPLGFEPLEVKVFRF